MASARELALVLVKGPEAATLFPLASPFSTAPLIVVPGTTCDPGLAAAAAALAFANNPVHSFGLIGAGAAAGCVSSTGASVEDTIDASAGGAWLTAGAWSGRSSLEGPLGSFVAALVALGKTGTAGAAVRGRGLVTLVGVTLEACVVVDGVVEAGCATSEGRSCAEGASDLSEDFIVAADDIAEVVLL